MTLENRLEAGELGAAVLDSAALRCCLGVLLLPHPSGRRQELAVAAALAFAIMCAPAAAELFGRLWQDFTKGATHESQGANPGQIP